ncbi:MAG TPA: hypothetical protein ENJ01_05245 [Gammaproteobacteria bacterium]|nr:hypothetical protein [Gammaproteobacteria bacterium]
MRKLPALIFSLALVTMVLSFATTRVMASAADLGRHGATGVIICGGNQLMRNKGSEFHWTAWTLRNFDNHATLFIERMRFIDARGNTLYDSAISGLPVFVNGVLGPLDNGLDPHQTALLSSRDVFGRDVALPKTQRPIQLIIDWSAESHALTLDAVAVRVVRERAVTDDGAGNVTVKIGAERSRHASACRTVRHGH